MHDYGSGLDMESFRGASPTSRSTASPAGQNLAAKFKPVGAGSLRMEAARAARGAEGEAHGQREGQAGERDANRTVVFSRQLSLRMGLSMISQSPGFLSRASSSKSIKTGDLTQKALEIAKVRSPLRGGGSGDLTFIIAHPPPLPGSIQDLACQINSLIGVGSSRIGCGRPVWSLKVSVASMPSWW